jgi:hypothetical protein
MMNLTAEQQHALQSGQAVQVDIGGTACILLRKEVYDRGDPLDFGPWTPAEMDLLAADRGLDAHGQSCRFGSRLPGLLHALVVDE